jgi:hypothetical protein
MAAPLNTCTTIEQQSRVVPTATKKIYAAGFQGLVKRLDKFLNLYGDYVEK